MRQIRNTVWPALVAVVFATAACSQNMLPLPEEGAASSSRTPFERTDAGRPVHSEQSGDAARIAGRISITEALAARLNGSEVLYIMARRGGGAPLAVKRISSPRFPMTYELTPEDQMVQGPPFSGEVAVSARIDIDGAAGPPQPGDMEGGVPQVQIGETNVDIVIDKLY